MSHRGWKSKGKGRRKGWEIPNIVNIISMEIGSTLASNLSCLETKIIRAGRLVNWYTLTHAIIAIPAYHGIELNTNHDKAIGLSAYYNNVAQQKQLQLL